jgi:hypothetical protein
MTDDERFRQHLEDSKFGVQVIADWFTMNGYAVRLPPVRVCKNHAEWKAFADDGDLFIESRIEVKHLGVDFTCREDWPFGEKFIVCAKHSWDRAQPKPQAYYVLNKQASHLAIVLGRTSNEWFVEERRDSRYDDVEQSFYFCPLDKVIFKNIHQP